MRWWTSDLHIGHYNIIAFCPDSRGEFWTVETVDFAPGPAEVDAPDVERMNNTIIDNWNDRVDDGDEIWVVGDLAMGHLPTSISKVHRLKGRKYLVPGNHDPVHRMYPHWRKSVDLFENAGFTILDSQVETVVDGTDVLVCHFPYTGDSKFTDRYTGLRPDDTGGWLIHGHTHSTTKIRDKQIHVGVDAWGLAPASEDEIAQIIRGNP